MSNHKIIFTGPVGAGKTTAISSISDMPPLTTDEAASDMTRNRKSGTTVAMDYGVMNLQASERIHLYGTPGQERFDWSCWSTTPAPIPSRICIFFSAPSRRLLIKPGW